MERLVKEPFLNGFEVKKSSKMVRKTDSYGSFIIPIAGYTSVDPIRNQEFSLMISPHFYREFSVLENWNKGLISVSSSHSSGRFGLKMDPKVELKNTLDFLRTGEDFEDDYSRLCSIIREYGLPFFQAFSTLEDAYKAYIEPLLSGSSFTIVRYSDLVLTRIVAPQNVIKLKEWIIDHKDYVHPVVYSDLYSNLDEVCDIIIHSSFEV